MVKSRKYKYFIMISSIKLVFLCFYLLFRPLLRGFLKLGQKYKNILFIFLIQMKTLKFAFEIYWALVTIFKGFYLHNVRQSEYANQKSKFHHNSQLQNKVKLPSKARCFFQELNFHQRLLLKKWYCHQKFQLSKYRLKVKWFKWIICLLRGRL